MATNQDNGPECHSRRSQFLSRIVAFARKCRPVAQLACCPPYHGEYNPVERCWGILEMHRNGSLLDSTEAFLGFARSMTWKGKHPAVDLVETDYAAGVKLTVEEMKRLEAEVIRLPSLEKWFVTIPSKRGRPRKT